MAHTDSNRTADRKARDLARKAARRERYAPTTLDTDALVRELQSTVA